MEKPSWFVEVDHTGDTGILVEAPDVEALFERAAWAMFTILTDLENVAEKTSRNLTVRGSDRDDLLVRWLSDLNFLHLTERVLFCRFKVLEFTDRRLTAEVWGEALDGDRHRVHTEIKAVTYHGLQIRESGGGWSAQVIFDL